MKSESRLLRRRSPASAPIAAGDDPIFVVIAEHKAAHAARVLAMKTLFPNGQDIDPDNPEYAAAEDREEKALKALFTTAPTTAAGVATWLKHLGTREIEGKNSHITLVSPSIRGWFDRGRDFHNRVEHQLLAAAAVLRRAQS
jgi:hypothetical protein